ncbi:MAG: hypothetical protein AB2417_04565 [Clostridiaceae bacterium]
MKKICKLMGKVFLSMAALMVVAAPASFGSVGVEEMPESMTKNR